MMTSFYSDKYLPAELPDICTPRQTLLRALHKAADSRIVYVCAPAGCGKSVSVRLWLAHTGRKATWIGLDRYDNTPFAFYRLLATGLYLAQPENLNMKNILSDPAFSSSPVEHTVASLYEFIPDGIPRALVLDDMHFITHGEIVTSLPDVLKRLPHDFTVWMLTRGEPLGEHRTAVQQRKIARIDKQTLMFTEEDTHDYISRVGWTPTEEELKFTCLVTEGWPVGVKAIAMKGRDPLRQGENVFNDYLWQELWGRWDEYLQDFMLKTSVVDEMTPDLCDELTGEPGSRDILEKLCHVNIFISRVGDAYRYHPIFLDFLRDRLDREDKAALILDKVTLYRKAAEWYHQRGDYLKAAHYFIQSGDQAGIAESLGRLRSYSLDSNIGLPFEFTKEFIFGKLSKAYIESNPELVCLCTWVSYLDGNAERFFYYMDLMCGDMRHIVENNPTLTETVTLIGGLDSRVPLYRYSREIHKRLSITGQPAEAERKTIWVATITQNLPFMHRSMRDYSEFALDTDNRLRDLSSAFAPLIGQAYGVIEACVRAGLAYEQNDLPKALTHAFTARACCEARFGAESMFCVGMLLSAIYEAMQNKAEAAPIKTELTRLINQSTYLRPNWLAFETKCRLADGDKAAATQWLASYFADESSRPVFYKIYQHFTTVRALIVMERAETALGFLQSLAQMGAVYGRPLDVAEAGVLRAALEWALGRKKESQETLGQVLADMQPYGFVRVIAEEGAAVTPVLKRIAAWVRRESYTGGLSLSYVNKVLLAAHRQARYHKGITCHIITEGKPVKLSKQQKHMLVLLSKGYRNADIAAATGLKIPTIKNHTAIAYEKLGVHNAMDAVLAARELGLIE